MKTLASYQGFFDLARQYAIKPGDSQAAASGKQGYVVLLFVEDRIAPAEKLQMVLSDKKTGTSGYNKGSKVLDFQGWRVGVEVYNFALFNSKPIYIKVLHTPVRNETGSRQLIGSYSPGR